MEEDINRKINWCISEIQSLRRKIDTLEKPLSNKPWYMSFGIWLAIFCGIALVFILYIFYLSQNGWTFNLPQ